MKVPKYIEAALERRVKAAEVFNETDSLVSHWCYKHNIETDEADTFSGAESIANPEQSAERILQAIRDKE